MNVLARGGRSRAFAAIAVLATVALVAVGASPAEAVPIKRGHSHLILDQNIFSVLDPLGVGILPTSPAEAITGGESFPITGGKVSRNRKRAIINHRGAIVFGGDNNAAVSVVRPKVHLCPAGRCRNSELTASVDGQRMSFLSLGRRAPTSRGRRLAWRGNARLTREAADRLNQTFATDTFQEGARLGTLRIRLTLAR